MVVHACSERPAPAVFVNERRWSAKAVSMSFATSPIRGWYAANPRGVWSAARAMDRRCAASSRNCANDHGRVAAARHVLPDSPMAVMSRFSVFERFPVRACGSIQRAGTPVPRLAQSDSRKPDRICQTGPGVTKHHLTFGGQRTTRAIAPFKSSRRGEG